MRQFFFVAYSQNCTCIRTDYLNERLVWVVIEGVDAIDSFVILGKFAHLVFDINELNLKVVAGVWKYDIGLILMIVFPFITGKDLLVDREG